MKKAAKEKTILLLAMIALAGIVCAPSFASSHTVLPLENRVEIFLLTGENHVEQTTFDTVKHVELEVSEWGVALGSSVAPKRLAAPLNLAGREGKLTQHAVDWGIGTKGAAPSGAARQVAAIVRHIHKGARQIRQGTWRNQVDDAIFYFNGKHIVVTKPDGTFITVLKNAAKNKWFNQADILFQK